MMIFETDRVRVRKLKFSDIDDFHKMESNPNVMKYATGTIKNYDEDKKELSKLINKYTELDNDFWIYGIERKNDLKFIGTCALVKDGKDDEIGYRFLQKYWGNGYGTEICKGMISYCRQHDFQKLVGYVIDENTASAKILEKLNFKLVKKQFAEDLQLPETKYEIYL